MTISKATLAEFAFGDVVLVPFPFTDQTASKRRPAVVISRDPAPGARPDVILMAVTSRTSPQPAEDEVRLRAGGSAGLPKPSIIKPVVMTLERRLVIRRLGRLTKTDQKRLRKLIRHLMG
jgi:mRNA interferase MazF